MKKVEKPATSSRAKSDKADKAGKSASAKKGAPAPVAKKAAGKAAKPDSKAESKAKSKAPAAKKAPAKAAKPARGKAASSAAERQELQAELPLPSGEPGGPFVDASDASDARDIQDAVVVAETHAAAEPERAPELSDEEKELSSLYGDDLSAPTLAHGEFKDQKTADEDRPMLPEINAREERRRGWEDRRERRRQEREQRRAARRDGHRGADRGGNRPHERAAAPAVANGGGRPDARPEGRPEARPERTFERPERGDRGDRPERGDRGDRGDRPSTPPAIVATGAAAGAAAAAAATPVFGTPMAVATAALFAQLRNGQPIPVRQLAAMLRKRSLIEGDPEQVWPQLRAELLADERAYRAIGLRPRVVHRGRDLFAPGPSAMSSVGELEGQLVTSVTAISAATVRGLTAWMAAASPAAFERLIHAYVVAIGYRDVEWVKRVDGIAYAQGIAPGIDRPVLLSARSGGAPIDRRGVGELRVGVEAKGLPFGTLFAAAGLSPEAERELERAGRSISVVCGDALASSLVSAGIGVARTAISVRFLDEQFLDDLSALPA